MDKTSYRWRVDRVENFKRNTNDVSNKCFVSYSSLVTFLSRNLKYLIKKKNNVWMTDNKEYKINKEIR